MDNLIQISDRLRERAVLGSVGAAQHATSPEALPAEAARILYMEDSPTQAAFGELRHAAGDGVSFRVTFSAGIAMLEQAMDLEQWRSAADVALYGAKAAGRNRVVLACPALAGSGVEMAPATE
ncbi:MAG TPA: diguanylate cyclase, partial [Thermoanaerobaculia bacterium]|nr:diguanylate cyclase [Thermoanaerobaculia bacterium]